ncbi:MAG: 2,3,4,5-tetrahydropyridine-2,6-dicarboxylate N-succinyltransferase [Bacteroidota bacterium]|nr:2,3,4,5-tetrahydropyridine-2,6-dicarboxylate N-succinyltransferase [Candidatus Kapabacteria bacterium]MDW8220166.1 2,3,4,5-tetrahydropyridine-2,6-dicarboxylate N-succinyltransferase [Bacteroidota bacterium]
MTLQDQIELLSVERAPSENEVLPVLSELLSLLNAGKVRAAEQDLHGNWRANTWVKKGIVLCFKYGRMVDMSIGEWRFFDKHTIPIKHMTLEHGVRIVPGGSAIRSGAYVARGVICMPPMYINIGAYVDEGTMVDSHVLIGTCAQIGKRVHISAAAQIGGVLEPAGARPVIIEDDVFIGGNCGVYEGVIVRKRAVLGSGVILNSSTKIFDIVHNRMLEADEHTPLEVPEGAVIVSGTRPLANSFAQQQGLAVYTPIIVKYRDAQTDAKTVLESALR